MSQPPAPERAIGNQAKKADEATTKGGTAKLKFVPTFAARKKPEAEVKQEPSNAGASSSSSKPSAGRGRGRGRGRGGPGGGERPSAPRPEETMVASGPFAMGPALATGRRAAPRTVFAPVAPGAGGLASSLSALPPFPTTKKEPRPKAEADDEDEAEQYSDPDAGVEIVDLSDVRRMDYMAPETLRRERKAKPRVKLEDHDAKLFEMAAGPSRAAQAPQEPAEFVLVDLDDSDELQELVRALTGKQDDMEITPMSHEIFVFQFPQPFPAFVPTAPAASADAMDVDAKDDSAGAGPSSSKPPAPALKSDKAKGKERADAGPSRHVSFADEVKPLTADDDEGAKKEQKKIPLDGLIGQLEIYDDGSLKMRLGENILLNVNSATPASYLQQAVHLHREKKAMVVLGEVRQRYVVSPDLDGLLDELDQEDDLAAAAKGSGQTMDTS